MARGGLVREDWSQMKSGIVRLMDALALFVRAYMHRPIMSLSGRPAGFRLSLVCVFYDNTRTFKAELAPLPDNPFTLYTGEGDSMRSQLVAVADKLLGNNVPNTVWAQLKPSRDFLACFSSYEDLVELLSEVEMWFEESLGCPSPCFILSFTFDGSCVEVRSSCFKVLPIAVRAASLDEALDAFYEAWAGARSLPKAQ